MMKRYLIPTIAAFIALAGCTKEVQEQRVQPTDSGNVHTLSVEIESGAYQAVGEGETKASMEAVIRVKWKQDDSVSVVNSRTRKLLGGCLTAQSDGESVVFEGTVTGAIAQDDKLYYIYPRVEDNAEEKDFDGYDISLAGQTYDGDNIGDVCFYGYAEDQAGSTNNTISKKIKFTLVTSYAHLNIANLPVKSTSLSRIDISNVNEGFTWTLSEKTLSAEAYPGNNAISVKCGNANITSYGNAVVRFAIPASAGTGDKARVVTVNNAYTNDKYTRNELLAAAYYNQLYTTWESKKVEVKTAETTEEGTNKIEVTIDNNDSKDVAEGAIPTEAFGKTGQDSKPTETKISIGGLGNVTFDEDATAQILANAEKASATSVLFKVEDVTTTKPVENADIVYEVTMKTLDENGTEVFSEDKAKGKVTMSIPLEDDVAYVHTITLVDSDGNPIDGGVIPESIKLDLTNHILSFDVEHFSKYAVGYVTEKDFVSVTGVALDESSVTLAVDETKMLSATVAPEEATNKKVKWSSSDEAVATVDKDGKVTGVAAGTAIITVTTEDVMNASGQPATASCTVTVVVPVTGVTLNKAETTLAAGGTETLTATVAPDNATNKKVVWSSDKETVATVDKDGKVTAVAAGTATITVTTVDGSKTATCAVTVTVPVTGVSLNKSSISLAVGKDETLTATVNPTNATNKKVTWSSNNTAVATVDKDGKVTGVAAGTATITVTTVDGSKTATCAVTVIPEGFVDLGVKGASGKTLIWGECNLGASKPWEYGNYYAWGATEKAYSSISSNTFNFVATRPTSYGGSGWNKSKGFDQVNAPYYSGSSYNKYTSGATLQTMDDAAYKASNGEWRMPTAADIVELFKQCYVECGSYNGVNGLIVYKAKSSDDAGYAYFNSKMNKYSGSGNTWNTTTKKRPSYSTTTDKFVFFPATGDGTGTALQQTGIGGHYWSSSLTTTNKVRAYNMFFNNGQENVGLIDNSRHGGYSIRPVKDL